MTVEQFMQLMYCILAFILGACFGSFSNVVIYRLPIGESLAMGASHCTSCGKKIRPYDNIPILSYIILGGKCRDCKAKISPRYVIVESLNALLWLALAVFTSFYGYAYAISCMFFITAMIAAAFIDREHGIIPDSLSVFIAVIGAIACFFDKTFVTWQYRLYGFLFGALFFGAFWAISKFVFKKEGMGFGDVKLMAATGLVLGLKATFFATLLASIAGSIVLGIKAAKNKEKSVEYPFAPFLAAGAITAVYFGQTLVDAYLNLFL